MSDDDDDGVDPQIEDVNEYYFEDDDEKPVCFSILPFHSSEKDSGADFSSKDVILHGSADKSPRVYKKVIAWKIRLDCEQPNIYVLDCEQHKWIKLLKPRKCYVEYVRSILITVQMLHFFRRGGQRRSLKHLWDHLYEVFGKYNLKPEEDDLMKHHTIIKSFVEKDQTLMKSKILQRLIKNDFARTKKALGLEAQLIVRDRRRVRRKDDNSHGNKDDSGDDGDDVDGSSDGDGSSVDDDNDNSDDDGTDQICAICDDGGELLSCEGPCKRSFHPTKRDGKESECETLGYTSAEIERIGTYLCANCKNKEHQCFICGELEPSHGPNAKVFQCNRPSCGYFYHPKCVAPLLDPSEKDGARGLERRIMEGMSFPCPIHWCFKCGRMENKPQRTLAMCRCCPRAYHRECLPREISFGTKDKDGIPRAWKLSKTILIYCLDHEIDKNTRTASRSHIKFPATPECTKTKELGNSKGRMTGKRRKNTDHQSTKPTDLSKRLRGAESEQADNVGAKSTSPQIVVEPHCAAKRLKGDTQTEQSIIGVAASQNGTETMKGHEKQLGTSSCGASTETEERLTCLAQKGTCLGIPYDGPSTKGMSDCSAQDTPVDKDVKLDNVVCTITENKYANGREKAQEHYTREETACCKDSSDNQRQNDVLEVDNLWVDMQADGGPLEPGNKRDKELQEVAYGLGSASGQEKEAFSRREDTQLDREVVLRNDSKIIDYRKDGTTEDNVDDHSSKKQGNGSNSCLGERSPSKCNDCLVAIDQDTSIDRSKKKSQPVEKASDGDKTDLDKNKKNLKEDGIDAHYEDRTEWNRAADRSGYKCRGKTQSVRREEPVGRNTRTRSREHSPERQRMECSDRYPGRENPRSDREMVPRNDNKIIHYRKDGMTVDNVDDHSPENQGNGSNSCQGERSPSKRNDCLVAIDQDTSIDRSKKKSQPVEKASDGNKTDLDKNKKNLREDGMDAYYEDRRTERNRAADRSGYKCRDKTQSDRREEPVGRNTRTRSREHSLERRRMEHGDSYPETNNNKQIQDGRDAHYEDRRTERNTAADTSRYKLRDKTQSDRRQEPVGRNTRTRSREHSSERQRMERGDSSPETNNDKQIRESLHGVNSSRRQWSPCQSSFPQAEFGGDHSHPYQGDSQYRTSGRHNPPRYLGYRPHSTVPYQLAGGSEGSRASRPVTDKYAPHLERTNYIY